MAVELAINPDCVRRAYAILEQEGFVNFAEGTGIFVADKRSAGDGTDLGAGTELSQLCLDLLAQAERRGLDSNDVVKMIETLAQGRMSS